MFAWVNGQIIDVNEPAITVKDRSFRYGDGLFETIRVRNGQPFLWEKHMTRLKRGAEFFKMPTPREADLERAVRSLIERNACPDCVARIHFSRGAGERGYSFKNCGEPLALITTHEPVPAPSPVKMLTSSVRVLADDPAARFKTANRLPNIRAKNEAEEAGANEALILNHRENLAEASAANIFCLFENELATPPLNDGIVAGTTRELILEIAPKHGLNPIERPLKVDDLHRADSVFLTSSVLLVAPVHTLNGIPLRIDDRPNILLRAVENLQ
jgi:branched-chain amino acid aminotransferase